MLCGLKIASQQTLIKWVIIMKLNSFDDEIREIEDVEEIKKYTFLDRVRESVNEWAISRNGEILEHFDDGSGWGTWNNIKMIAKDLFDVVRK